MLNIMKRSISSNLIQGSEGKCRQRQLVCIRLNPVYGSMVAYRSVVNFTGTVLYH
jgi:hypothetical protein